MMKSFLRRSAAKPGGRSTRSRCTTHQWRENMTMPKYGRGFARMKAVLGPEKSEQMRQQVLRDQEAALSEVGKHRVAKLERDRTGYTDYPEPKNKSTRRKP